VLQLGGDLYIYLGSGNGNTGPSSSFKYSGDITDDTKLIGVTGPQGPAGSELWELTGTDTFYKAGKVIIGDPIPIISNVTPTITNGDSGGSVPTMQTSSGGQFSYLEFINPSTNGYTITLNKPVTVNYVLIGSGGKGVGHYNVDSVLYFDIGGSGGRVKGSFNLSSGTQLKTVLGSAHGGQAILYVNNVEIARATAGNSNTNTNAVYDYNVGTPIPSSTWFRRLENPTYVTSGTGTVTTSYGTASPATPQYLTLDDDTIPVYNQQYAQSRIRVPSYTETFDGTTIQYGINGYGQLNNAGLKGGGGGWFYSSTTGGNGGNSYFLLYFTKTVSETNTTPKITLTNNYIQFPDGSQQTSSASQWTTTGTNISYDAGNISTTKTITAATFNTTSDYRVKENVETLDLNVYRTDHLRPVSYLNKLSNKYSLGLIAHELQEQYSFLVDGEKDGEKIQSVDYIGIIAILIKEIQELKNILKKNKIE
jgi:hypothetical protein